MYPNVFIIYELSSARQQRDVQHRKACSVVCLFVLFLLLCYTAVARLGFKRRAAVVLKSNLIRSIQFGTAVARPLKRALAYLDIHQYYKSAFLQVIQDISAHRELAGDWSMSETSFVFPHHTISCTHSRISIHSSYRPLRKREQNVSRNDFFYDASQHQERDEIIEDACWTTFRNSKLDCIVIVLL